MTVSIYDLTSRIRDLINAPRQQSLLINDSDTWYKLCASLDAIGDTDLALDSHTERRFPADSGSLYIVVYGVLQVLYVQQDATRNLLAALNIDVSPADYPRLRAIRDIRNASVGHPTSQRFKGTSSYHFITRVTLNQDGFMLLSRRSDQSIQWIPVRLTTLISEQREDIGDVLRKVIKELEAREQRHRDEFRSEKLEALLPHGINYHFQKMNEATAGKTGIVGAGLGQISAQMVREALGRVGDDLTRRNLLQATHLDDSIGEIDYALQEIEGFFETVKTGIESRLNEKIVYMCAFFAEHRVDALRVSLREIDERYASPVSRGTARPPAKRFASSKTSRPKRARK